MVCSNCKQDGHTKNKCPNTILLINNSQSIVLDGDILLKLTKLELICHEVANNLGKGFVEGVYQQALCLELQELGIKYISEESMPIIYKERPIGGGHNHRLDIILLDFLDFIFELKAAAKIVSINYWQLIRYMSYKKISYGAVVNFNQSEKNSLEVQFIVYHENDYWLYDISTQSGTKLLDFNYHKL